MQSCFHCVTLVSDLKLQDLLGNREIEIYLALQIAVKWPIAKSSCAVLSLLCS